MKIGVLQLGGRPSSVATCNSPQVLSFFFILDDEAVL